MLTSFQGMDRIMLLLLFEGGLEVDELINVRASNIDMNEGIILLPNGSRLKVSTQTLEEMKSYLEARPNQSYLFEGRCGKPITVKWKRCVLDKLIPKAKLAGQIEDQN